MLAAFGQRDVQRRCRFHGVFEEQFVEIAHAIEQEAVRVIGFDAQKLRHHGRDATLRDFRWRWWRYELALPVRFLFLAGHVSHCRCGSFGGGGGLLENGR